MKSDEKARYLNIQLRAWDRHNARCHGDWECCHCAACATLQRYEARNYRDLFDEGTPLFCYYEAMERDARDDDHEPYAKPAGEVF